MATSSCSWKKKRVRSTMALYGHVGLPENFCKNLVTVQPCTAEFKNILIQLRNFMATSAARKKKDSQCSTWPCEAIA